MSLSYALISFIVACSMDNQAKWRQKIITFCIYCLYV